MLWAQPAALSQLSAVQAFLSSQLIATPAHTAAAEQTSGPVHASASLQAAPGLAVPTQAPVFALQASFVHALPSLQGPADGVLLHFPLTLSQLSNVQTFPSSQLTADLPKQVALAWQASALVHASLSLQANPTAGVDTHFPPTPQPSLVHALPSSQNGVPLHLPPRHTSLIVQLNPSSQLAPSALTWLQPVLLSQASVVQALPSSQFSALPPTHAPTLHKSPVVHTLPSSQLPAEGSCTQPSLAPQLSAVHTLLSSQFSATPAQPLLPQTSLWVQGLLSSQAEPLTGVKTQPVNWLQLSLVHGFLSSQTTALPPIHLAPLGPIWQVSPVVHGS